MDEEFKNGIELIFMVGWTYFVGYVFASAIPMPMNNNVTNTFRAVAKNGELRFYCNNVARRWK